MKEQELFDWLKATKFGDLEKSTETFDGFDCISAHNEMFIELKSRKTHYPELLIEKMKYDFLLSEARERDYIPYYINYTPEGIWSFNLAEIPEITWQEKWLPVTTEFANKNNKMKMVGFLSVDWGVKLS